MTPSSTAINAWLLDSSTFIHAEIAGQTRLLLLIRKPTYFPSYVYRVELGSNAHEPTRARAQHFVKNGQILLKNLSLEDLDQIAQLKTPRKVGLGELACAIIASRENGVALCDDRKCRNWIKDNLRFTSWQSIEDILLDAAAQSHLSEFELEDIQKLLAKNKYQCQFDLRSEYLIRRLNGL